MDPESDMLAGMGDVAATMFSQPANSTLRSPPPPAGAQSSMLSSPVISLTLSGANGPVSVNNSNKPIVLASPVGNYSAEGLQLDANCSVLVHEAEVCAANASIFQKAAEQKEVETFYEPSCWCTDTAAGDIAVADAAAAGTTSNYFDAGSGCGDSPNNDGCPTLDLACLCEKKGWCDEEAKADNCLLPTPTFGSAASAFADAVVEVTRLNARLDEANLICGTIPAPCSGRGTCNNATDLCDCEDGWTGVACTQRPDCNYMTPEGTWSNEGCTLVSSSPETGAVCACTHLTEFGVVADLLNDIDSFSASDIKLEINVPGSLTLEELSRFLRRPSSTASCGAGFLASCSSSDRFTPRAGMTTPRPMCNSTRIGTR
jgi:hypothetical protein